MSLDFCFTEESVVKLKYDGNFIQANFRLLEAIILPHTFSSASTAAL